MSNGLRQHTWCDPTLDEDPIDAIKWKKEKMNKKIERKKEKGRRKRKKKKEIRRSEKKENKLGEYLLFSDHHLYCFHLSLSSIIIHIIWELNYIKWYHICF